MSEILRSVIFYWLAFNAVILGIVLGLSFVRAFRRKRLIRDTSVGQLMAAHFDSVRRDAALSRPVIDRDYPHQVTIRTPLGASDTRQAEMKAFCIDNAASCHAEADSQQPPRHIGAVTRFCFTDPTHADAFEEKFGGERITIVARVIGNQVVGN